MEVEDKQYRHVLDRVIGGYLDKYGVCRPTPVFKIGLQFKSLCATHSSRMRAGLLRAAG